MRCPTHKDSTVTRGKDCIACIAEEKREEAARITAAEAAREAAAKDQSNDKDTNTKRRK